MADFRYQWQQYLVFLHERDNIVIFNIVLVDFARQAAPSTFAIFTFMVPILVTCIQIKFSYAGTSSISSPFETHHTKFMVAMLSLLAYCCFAIAATQNYFAWRSSSPLRSQWLHWFLYCFRSRGTTCPT
ncbi:hypothetical protein M0R45_004157 [Rubus argutus]|uniref:Uncharacterized protein n=1 Tax=Rubus argutus TaxID=59490 RepID=A0AAW1YIY8_RUBAR